MYVSEAWDSGTAECQSLRLGTEQDLSPTPITEEPMENMDDAGSSLPPWHTSAWFLDDHHSTMDSPTSTLWLLDCE